MLNKQNLAIIASGFCLIAPAIAVVAMNWEQARPYLIADVKTARGHVLYLYAPG